MLAPDDIEAHLSNLGLTPDTRSHAYLSFSMPNAELLDVSALASFPHLQNIDLANNRLDEAALSVLSGLRHLRSLCVARNCLSHFPPFALSEVRALEEVDASGNGISNLTRVGARLKYLNKLDLQANEITNLAPLTGTSSADTLPALRELLIDHNRITSLTTLSSPHLRVLSVSNNDVFSLSDMQPLESLSDLDVSRNHIASLDGLDLHPRLTRLNLAWNAVDSTAELKRLAGLACLSELDLRYNPVSEVDGFRVEALFILPQLTVLNGEPVSPEEKIAAANAHGADTRQHESILRFFLPKASETTEKDFLSLRDPLHAGLPEQQYWDRISERGFLADWEDALVIAPEVEPVTLALNGVQLGDVGWWVVACIVRENPSVRHINLAASYSHHRWTSRLSRSHGLRELVRTLSAPTQHIISLDLSRCQLGITEGELLSQIIGLSTKLERFVAAGNALGEHLVLADEHDDHSDEDGYIVRACPGLSAVFHAILHSQSLLHCDLSDNGIDDNGAQMIAACVSSKVPLFTLRTLLLSNNPSIGPYGASLLADALRNNDCLERLVWSDSRLPGEAITALGHSLAHANDSVRTLDLSHNVLTQASVEAIAGALQSPVGVLRKLVLSDCELTSEHFVALGDALAKLRGTSLLEDVDVSFNADASAASVGHFLHGLAGAACSNHLASLDLSGLRWDARATQPLIAIAEANSESLHSLRIGTVRGDSVHALEDMQQGLDHDILFSTSPPLSPAAIPEEEAYSGSDDEAVPRPGMLGGGAMGEDIVDGFATLKRSASSGALPGGSAGLHILKAIQAAASLEYLDVTGLGLSAEVMTSIAHVLERGVLEEAFLGGNHFNIGTWKTLSHALRISCAATSISLLGLLIEDAHVRAALPDVVGSLARSSAFNGTLSVLDLQGLPLGDAGVFELAQGLDGNEWLRVLKLRKCDLGGLTGAARYRSQSRIAIVEKELHARELQHQRQLEASLRGGDVLNEEIEDHLLVHHMHNAVDEFGSPVGQQLQGEEEEQLVLDDEEDHHEGLRQLIDVVCSRTRVVSLDLSFNGLTAAALHVLAEPLSRASGLTSLDLSGNTADLDSCLAVAEILRQNSSLQCLSVPDVLPDDTRRCRDVLVHAFVDNTTLCDIDLGNLAEDGVLSVDEAEALLQALQLNENAALQIVRSGSKVCGVDQDDQSRSASDVDQVENSLAARFVANALLTPYRAHKQEESDADAEE